MDPNSFAQSVANLRKSRLRPEREVVITRDLSAALDTTRRAAKSLGNIGAAWATACPPELLERTNVTALHRNVLTITVDDSATKFVLDRWLRDGGENALIRACGAAVARVKLVSGGEGGTLSGSTEPRARARGQGGEARPPQSSKSAKPRRGKQP
ncbi:MAG: hypothetical protein ACKVZJ_11525 [Phycisphaerales bacterium]